MRQSLGWLVAACCALAGCASEELRLEPVAPRRDASGDSLAEGAIARLGTERLATEGWVQEIAFSPDGTLIAAVDRNGLHVWDATSGRVVQTLATESPAVSSLGFLPDGKIVVGWRETISLLDPKENEVVRTCKLASSILALAVAPDGETVAIADARRHVVVREIGSWSVRQDLVVTGHVLELAFRRGKNQLLVRENGLSLWDLATGKCVGRALARSEGARAAFSPDGRLLAVAAPSGSLRIHRVLSTRPLDDLQGWSPAPGDETGALRRSDELGRVAARDDVAFSPDGKKLVALERPLGVTPSAALPWIAVWDTESGALARVVELPAHVRATRLALAPDGKRVALVGASGIAVLDLESRALAREPRVAGVTALVFSKDGATADTLSQDGTIATWNVETGELVRSRAFCALSDLEPFSTTNDAFPFYVPGETHVHRCSADRTRFARITGNGARALHEVEVWDGETHGRLCLIKTREAVLRIALCGDGRLIVTAGKDGSVRLWDASTGALLRVIAFGDATEEVVTKGIAFSPDGRRLAVWSPRESPLVFSTAIASR